MVGRNRAQFGSFLLGGICLMACALGTLDSIFVMTMAIIARMCSLGRGSWRFWRFWSGPCWRNVREKFFGWFVYSIVNLIFTSEFSVVTDDWSTFWWSQIHPFFFEVWAWSLWLSTWPWRTFSLSGVRRLLYPPARSLPETLGVSLHGRIIALEKLQIVFDINPSDP